MAGPNPLVIVGQQTVQQFSNVRTKHFGRISATKRLCPTGHQNLHKSGREYDHQHKLMRRHVGALARLLRCNFVFDLHTQFLCELGFFPLLLTNLTKVAIAVFVQNFPLDILLQISKRF